MAFKFCIFAGCLNCWKFLENSICSLNVNRLMCLYLLSNRTTKCRHVFNVYGEI